MREARLDHEKVAPDLDDVVGRAGKGMRQRELFKNDLRNSRVDISYPVGSIRSVVKRSMAVRAQRDSILDPVAAACRKGSHMVNL